MKKQMGVIVTVYNDADNLDRWLGQIPGQTFQPEEIVIGDDGSSNPAVKDVIRKHTTRLRNIVHVWHSDHGYQRAKIINRAVEASTAEYLVFTDSDCLMERHYLEDHLSLSRPRSFIQGNRAHVSGGCTADFHPSFFTVLAFCLRGRIYNKKCAWRSALLESFKGEGYWNMPVGANFSCGRAEFMEVNGFDERYQGWGGEDADIYARLKHAEVAGIFPRNHCVLFHLDHPVKPKNDTNLKLLAEVCDERRVTCERGVADSSQRAPAVGLIRHELSAVGVSLQSRWT